MMVVSQSCRQGFSVRPFEAGESLFNICTTDIVQSKNFRDFVGEK